MRSPPRQRQVEPDLGAFTKPAGDGDRAAETFDDVLGDRQAESGPFPPRREVRIEDVPHVVGADAGAEVLNGDGDPACGVARLDDNTRAAGDGDAAGPIRVSPSA